MAQHKSDGIQFIWRAALAAVAAVVVTLVLWLVTELVFGGAAIIGAIFGLATFIFTGMSGGEPVVRYQPKPSQSAAPTVPKAAPPASGSAPAKAKGSAASGGAAKTAQEAPKPARLRPSLRPVQPPPRLWARQVS